MIVDASQMLGGPDNGILCGSGREQLFWENKLGSADGAKLK